MLRHRSVIHVSLCVTFACCFLTTKRLDAQSLTEQLRKEPAAKLAADARAQGDPIRGAILFNRKSIECGRCHASGGNQPLGPDLSQLFKTNNDSQVIESILDPDKVIKEGFESVTVATVDGRVITGRLIEQSESRVVIRDGSAAGNAITLSPDDIDEIAPSQRSLMPSDLGDQLANRQQFLDLVAYVIQVAERGPVPPSDINAVPNRESLSEELQGRVLFDRYRCQACHSSTFDSLHESPIIAPNLAWAGGHLNPDYLAEFIADPNATHPHTKMPNMLASVPAQERQAVAKSIVHFLISPREKQDEATAIDTEAAQRGRELYHTVGCVACHTPFASNGKARFEDPFAAMGPLRRKYTLESLIGFLEDPHQARPSGRMPNMQLTHWEAIDIASYLLQRDQPSPAADRTTSSFQQDLTQRAQGAKWFQDLSCVRCHAIPVTSDDSSLAIRATTEEKAPAIPIDQVDGGCLSTKQGDWPRYELSVKEREMLIAALGSREQEIDAEAELELRLSTLNCTACHQRNGLGGVSQRLDEFFKTTDQNLGQQGRLPPRLDLVGAKLNEDWMRDVMVSHRSIRPYMLTRMPQFGVTDVADFISRFQTLDHVDAAPVKEYDEKILRDAGLDLVGNQGLNCVACHTYRFEKSDTMPAVDLTEMSARLKQDWFVHYMRAPQRFSPNTVMPTFWPDGHAVRKDVLDGDTDLQIQAIWRYLLDGRDARAPRGVVREPLELLATNEAILLRRSYPGIGKRGIGVGYPDQLNLAFDAEQMRLGMIWKGPFAEASGVFRGQGSGNVRPLGQDHIEFLKGPELDDADEPWEVDDGRPPFHHFEGYSLDEKQRPTFEYRYEDVQVRDFSSVSDALTEEERTAIGDLLREPRVLMREVTFTSEDRHDDLVFRIATGTEIKERGDHIYQFGKNLVIHVDHQFSVDVVSDDAGQKLLVKLNVTDSPTKLVVRYIW